MKYEIKGNDLPVVILTLNKGEKIITERGAMSWMSETIQMQTNAKKGGFGRFFTGESIFQNTFTATKDGDFIALSSSFPGQILVFDVTNKGLIVQKRAFLAREEDVEMKVYFQKKFGAGLFGGEGFIMQQFRGKGHVFLEIDGGLCEYDLKAGESLIVDTGYLAAMEETVSFDIVGVGGAKNAIFGGNGIFNSKLTGPGKIWIQSMPMSRLVQVLGIHDNN